MSPEQDSVQYVPYQQEDEPPRRAALTRVDVDVSGLSDSELQVAGHLMDAADAMNPIFRDQFEPRTEKLKELTGLLAGAADGEAREAIDAYRTMLDLQNGPYSLLPRKNHLLRLPREELEALANKAGGRAPALLEELFDLLTTGRPTPDRANFYPEDFTEEELQSLGEAARLVNSSVIRDENGRPAVLLNEERYRNALRPAIEHLRAARDLTGDPSFRLYLDAKLVELETGFEEARRLADYTWVKHGSPLDIVISTALEVYLDNFKNARGAATAGVYLRNRAAEELLEALVQRVQRWEATAPWTYKKTEIDPERLPKLKFVDVLAWSGDYVTGPFTTIAQSLPNDEWVIQNVGTVNMVYMNTGRAVHRVAGNLAAEEFLTCAEYERVAERLFDANQLHSALHEIGHTTGMMDPDHAEGQPKDYLEEEYSYLEETRAELFGLWALDLLLEEGVIDAETARACYDGMLVTMISSMKFDPVQAHNKARNGMFHVFEENGIIRRVEEEGKTRFEFVHERAHEEVTRFLAQIGDLKAAGDKAGVIALREKTVFTDPLKPEIEKRTADFPLGRGLIFPKLKREGGRYLRELVYPDHFREQEKFKLTLP